MPLSTTLFERAPALAIVEGHIAAAKWLVKQFGLTDDDAELAFCCVQFSQIKDPRVVRWLKKNYATQTIGVDC